MGDKIDEEEMLRMYKDGVSTAQIAKHFNCTWAAVDTMRKRVEKRLSMVPDVSRSELSRHNIDTVHQLKTMNDRIIHEMKRCNRLIEREDELPLKREKLEKRLEKNPDDPVLLEKIKKLAGDNVAGILKIQSNIIAISAEVRKQIELQVKIYETIYNVTMVAEFQEEIINVLREVDPIIKDEVIKRLKARRSLRGLVRVNP